MEKHTLQIQNTEIDVNEVVDCIKGSFGFVTFIMRSGFRQSFKAANEQEVKEIQVVFDAVKSRPARMDWPKMMTLVLSPNRDNTSEPVDESGNGSTSE